MRSGEYVESTALVAEAAAVTEERVVDTVPFEEAWRLYKVYRKCNHVLVVLFLLARERRGLAARNSCTNARGGQKIVVQLL
jgi:hypothetical protein